MKYSLQYGDVFSTDIILVVVVGVDRHCYHRVFKHYILPFLACSLPCDKFSGLFVIDLWLCTTVSSYGHVEKLPPIMELMSNMVAGLSLVINTIYISRLLHCSCVSMSSLMADYAYFSSKLLVDSIASQC